MIIFKKNIRVYYWEIRVCENLEISTIFKYKSLLVTNYHDQDSTPVAGLSKYRHQASHWNCAGTPSTLFCCIQQDPPTTPVLRKTPLQSFIVYTLVTLSTPSPESCTIIKILRTVHLKYYPLSVVNLLF